MNGDLTAITYADGTTNTFTYDARHNPVTMTDAMGNTVRFDYDGANLVKLTDASGSVYTFGYDALGRRVSATDPLGNTTKTVYDAAGRVITTQDAAGAATSYEYDAAGRVIASTDANGNRLAYTWDANDNLLSVTDKDGNVWKYTYDALGNKLTETDPVGNTLRFAYDSMGRMTASTDADGYTTRYEYDALGNETAVTAPDGLAVRNADNAIITELSASPGTAVQLHGSAAYKHLPLKADPAAFTWALEGDIGTIDETGLFTATALGTGKITVSAGTQSASIDVTVSTQHLETLEDFEGETTIFRGSGEGASFSLNRDGNYVRFGKASGKLDYDLTANAAGGTARWNATAQPAVLNAPYTGLNLWVDSNGSGNTLSLLYSIGEEEVQTLPLTTLDVSGWKQVSVNNLTSGITLRGLAVDGTGTGVIYLDQLVAAFDGIVDTAAPAITAELDQETWTVTGSISDGADGILPADRISITTGGIYEPATGRFTVTLPAPQEGLSRVTVKAKDYSGNISRASVDIPASGVTERRFSDTAEYWGADYCDFLYDRGITGGYDDGTFRPDALLTRLDFAVMLYNALRLDEAKYAQVALPFADLDKIPERALPAARALYAEGVVTGTQG